MLAVVTPSLFVSDSWYFADPFVQKLMLEHTLFHIPSRELKGEEEGGPHTSKN